MSYGIVDIKHMGDALRNTGYKSVSNAAAEIVDNSIEAGASDVFVILSETINRKSGRKIVGEIAFLDNGIGMNEEVLGKCLGIGATTRTARKGMGRFGVGLPQASLYACPRVEVYSWQNGFENCKKVFLDINAVKNGTQTDIADPVSTSLPDAYARYISYRTENKAYDFSKSGTLVLWKDCDRITPSTRVPLMDHLQRMLGKKFRHYIHEGKTEITVIPDEQQDGYRIVQPNDPLYLMEDNYVLCDPLKPDVACTGSSIHEGCIPAFVPWPEESGGDGTIRVPVKYYTSDGEVADSTVTITFSVVNRLFYDESAFPHGKNPGNCQFGKKFAKENAGISIVRAGREIDFGKFDYYEEVNEPTHRWWGCEIAFEPELDELFGVANNKQFVDLRMIAKEDKDEDVVPTIWDQLSTIIMGNIKSMLARNEEIRKKTRSGDSNKKIPLVDIINVVEAENEDGLAPVAEPSESDVVNAEQILIDQGNDHPTQDDVKAFFNNKLNLLYQAQGERGVPFDYRIVGSTVVLTINTQHKLYTEFLNGLNEGEDLTFKLVLAAAAMALSSTDARQKKANDAFVQQWYSRINQYIEEQLDPTVIDE